MMFSSLFLTVGDDNLPNFFVVEYFLKNNPALTEIYLIYSEKTNYQAGTKDYADALREIIKERHNNRNLSFHLIPLSNVTLPSQIRADLRRELCKNSPLHSEAHLNYTGGTKTMGIHAYQFLKENLQSKVSFSYLDEKTFQIVSDDKNRITGDLREQVEDLSLKETLKLHVVAREESPFPPRKAPESLQIIIENIQKFLEKDPEIMGEIIKKLPEKYKENNALTYGGKTYLEREWLEELIESRIEGVLRQECLYKSIETSIVEVRNKSYNTYTGYFEKVRIKLITKIGKDMIAFDTATTKEEAKAKALEVYIGMKKMFKRSKVVIVTPLSSGEASAVQNDIDVLLDENDVVILSANDLKNLSISLIQEML